MLNKLSIPEMPIKQIWDEKDFSKNNLRTIPVQSVEIEFAGWHHKGSGPDFKEALLQIGEQSLFDAVEIHVDYSGWYAHQHEKNPDYNSVVLHVVLYNSGKRLIEREDKFKIQELELASFIIKTLSTLETQARVDLKSFGELPGRFGVAAVGNTAEALKKVIVHAGEQPIQDNILLLLLLKLWDELDPEKLFF